MPRRPSQRHDAPLVKLHPEHGIIGVEIPGDGDDVAHPRGGSHAGELGYVALVPMTIESSAYGERRLEVGDMLLPEEVEHGDHGGWLARLVRTHMLAALPWDRGVLGLLRLYQGDA